MSGCTQYYPQNRDFTDKEWTKICDAFDFIEKHGVNKGVLQFNRRNCLVGLDCLQWIHLVPRLNYEEDFIISRLQDGRYRPYCETNRKPYDKYVTAILSIADYYAPGALEIDSDGYSICADCKNTKTTCDKVADNLGFGCWLPGILLATEVCGITHMPKGLEIELEE